MFISISELKHLDTMTVSFFLQHLKISSLEEANNFVDEALAEIGQHPNLSAIFSVNFDIFPEEAWRNEDFASKIIEQNDQAIGRVPVMFRTPSLCLQALDKNPEHIIYIELINFDIAYRAAKKDLELHGNITILNKDYINTKVREEVLAQIQKEQLENSLSISLTHNKKIKI